MNLCKLREVRDSGAWHAAVHGDRKESDMTEQLNINITRSLNCARGETEARTGMT